MYDGMKHPANAMGSLTSRATYVYINGCSVPLLNAATNPYELPLFDRCESRMIMTVTAFCNGRAIANRTRRFHSENTALHTHASTMQVGWVTDGHTQAHK